jgi:ribosomal protein S18 acetylase RimI-like enzyme
VTFEPVPLERALFRRGAELLARAFHEDPASVYLFPDVARRPGRLTRVFRLPLRYAAQAGVVLTSPGLDGVAVWLAPGRIRANLGQAVRAGALTLPFAVGPAAFRRMLTLMEAMVDLHRRTAPGRHWYLSTLGVDPSRQGQGVGAILLRPVLKSADEERLTCYRETMQPRNFHFYRRQGFEIAGESRVPGGPPFWGMVRPPGALA